MLKRAPLAAAILAAMHGTQVQAQDAQASGGGLEEVVVTAQKRAENLQNVPIAVSALDGEKLEQMDLRNFNDYAQTLPDVAYKSTTPGSAAIYMRGIASSSSQNLTGSLPAVGVYLDEQPITNVSGSIDVHIYDVARIEVLPGPQGTLYGASSEAGTMRIITNQPDTNAFKAGYDVQGNTVSHGGIGASAEGFANIPLSDNIAARVVGWYERDAGYLDNARSTVNFGGHEVSNYGFARSDWNPVTTYGGRAALKFNINDDWSITPMVMAQKTEWDGKFDAENWKAPASIGAPLPPLSDRAFSPTYGKDSFVDSTLTVTGKISNFDITYAGSYLKRQRYTDSDYTDYSLAYTAYQKYYQDPNAPWQTNIQQIDSESISNELRIASPKDYPIRFIAGLFQARTQQNWHHTQPVSDLPSNLWVGQTAPGTAPSPYLWPDTFWLVVQEPVTRDRAAFSEVYWDITSKLTATAGIRGFHYDNGTKGFNGFGLDALGTNPNFLTPAQLLAANPAFKPKNGEQGCIDNIPFNGAPCSDLDFRTSGSGWTPKFNLNYKFTPQSMAYLTYSEGYRPGGVNRFANAPPFTADYLKNYEFGWKSQWFDNHLRFNGSVYYEKWNNFQFSFSGANSTTVIANAAQADAKGAETELEWAVTRGLTLSLSGAYTDAQLRANYCGELDANGNPITTNPCPPKKVGGAPFAPTAPDGQMLPLSPKWKGSAGAVYTFPLGSAQGHVAGVYTYQSSVWPSLLNTERAVLGQLGGYGVANLTIGMDKDNYTVDLIVKNISDSQGVQFRSAGCTITQCGAIATYDNIIRPRLIGVQFGQKF